MLLLLVALMPFITGRIIMMDSMKDVDPVMSFPILVIMHFFVGWAAWSSHYAGFTNRLAYLTVMLIHVGTYAFNWECICHLHSRQTITI